VSASPEQIARVFGCSPAQVRLQFAKNARQLREMAAKAGTGKHRGKTGAEWAALADMAERKAAS
jgi:hypothetical protein